MKIKARYFFPNLFTIIIISAASFGFFGITNLVAQGNYEDKVLFNGECKASLDHKLAQLQMDCGKYTFSTATDRKDLVKFIEGVVPVCKVQENYRGNAMTSCSWKDA